MMTKRFVGRLIGCSCHSCAASTFSSIWTRRMSFCSRSSQKLTLFRLLNYASVMNLRQDIGITTSQFALLGSTYLPLLPKPLLTEPSHLLCRIPHCRTTHKSAHATFAVGKVLGRQHSALGCRYRVSWSCLELRIIDCSSCAAGHI